VVFLWKRSAPLCNHKILQELRLGLLQVLCFLQKLHLSNTYHLRLLTHLPLKYLCTCVSISCKSLIDSGSSSIHTSNYTYKICIKGYKTLRFLLKILVFQTNVTESGVNKLLCVSVDKFWAPYFLPYSGCSSDVLNTVKLMWLKHSDLRMLTMKDWSSGMCCKHDHICNINPLTLSLLTSYIYHVPHR
jgi:hypothetical protein